MVDAPEYPTLTEIAGKPLLGVCCTTSERSAITAASRVSAISTKTSVGRSRKTRVSRI